jgi:hypothetical protein
MGGDGGSGGSGVNPTCASSTAKADKVPLDLMVMLDQSGSMQGASWTGVTGALETFVAQPGLDGVSVGINYFGLPVQQACTVLTCTTAADCGAGCGPCVFGGCAGVLNDVGDSCNAIDYQGADVEIAALPGVATQINQSISKHTPPNTGTPTYPALQGVITHSQNWAKTHAGDAVVAVFATDGEPEECDTTTSDIAAIAAAGLAGTPKVLTFVIGVGSGLAVLDPIAAAGGTTKAFIVDSGANTNQEFLDAMNAIRHAALGCTYTIPLPVDGAPDYSSVNVIYTPSGGGAAVTIPYVNDKASCPASGNAWYYDNPAAPMQIVLCDATCGTIEADTMGEVDITLGCATVIE